MRFKLDENLDPRLAPVVAEGGHEVDTVLDEGLSGKDDDAVYQACLASGRILVTLDLDFSNPFRFPPAPAEGIIVVRPPRPVLSMIRAVLTGGLPRIKEGFRKGQLWIVEPERVRIYDPSDPTE
jgi:predicted nuclease of predicted toxin-antitoxin system